MPEPESKPEPTSPESPEGSEAPARYFEEKASRTGEEGIYFQPTGSHDTDPFVPQMAPPEASNPSSPQTSEPTPAPAADSAGEEGPAEGT